LTRVIRTAGALFALGLLLAACGAKRGTVQGGNDTFTATTLTVYADLPLQGPDFSRQLSIADGAALALYDAGGHVGPLHVSFVLLNDAGYRSGAWTAPQTGDSARTASTDQSSAAYIGDFDSGASAISQKLNNENGIVQILPGSGYVGFTDDSPANQPGDPGAYYPDGSHTLVRLIPSDAVQARAIVTLLRSQGVRRLYVISDTSDPLSADVAPLTAAAAPAGGITVAGRGRISTAASTPLSAYRAAAAAAATTHPDAVLLAGPGDTGAATLWRDLHSALPGARLVGSSTLARSPFLKSLAGAGASSEIVSPYLEPDQYPPSARAVFTQYRSRFHTAPTVFALYGYEAMRIALAAVKRAGRLAPNRASFLKTFHSLGTLSGVLGDFRFNANGDTSLTAFDAYRVTATGALTLLRTLP
jgi:branched-chain amino acid transport system substrate-binding protein